jgi:oxygen-independent coproporphyrinogen-3 oxidase
MDAYVARLCSEISRSRFEADKISAEVPREADSIYFGGGTPSLLSAQHFQQIFAALRTEFDVADEVEVTVECAPGQLADATLEELLRQGVNRVSLGVQSFIDREAAAVGRLHTGRQCEQEIARLRETGGNDVCLDLIAGLPHQTEASWRESVSRAIDSGVTHVSVYMLEVDDDSRLGHEILIGGTRYGAVDVPSEDVSAEWYELACALLDDANIKQYEISNFALPGHESRHNAKYWRRRPYLGFGLDAHSMLHGQRGAWRFQNTDDLDAYMGLDSPLAILSHADKAHEPEFIRAEAAFEETLFLGLRMCDGVELASVRSEFGDTLVAAVMPAVREICEAGLLHLDGERLRLTARGQMASNEVFQRLLISVPA